MAAPSFHTENTWKIDLSPLYDGPGPTGFLLDYWSERQPKSFERVMKNGKDPLCLFRIEDELILWHDTSVYRGVSGTPVTQHPWTAHIELLPYADAENALVEVIAAEKGGSQ